MASHRSKERWVESVFVRGWVMPAYRVDSFLGKYEVDAWSPFVSKGWPKLLPCRKIHGWECNEIMRQQGILWSWLSAKQRHLYLAPKLEGTGSFLMDHWNMINAPNFIFQPSFFEGCVSFQRDLGVYFSLLVGWSYRLLGSVTPSNSPRWVIQNSSLNSNPLSISITCSTTPFVSIPFCEVGFSPLAISPLVNVGNHLPPSVKARNFGPIHLRAAPPRIKSPSFFLEVAQQKHNQPKKYVHIMPWN